jgi:hypothetical protein
MWCGGCGVAHTRYGVLPPMHLCHCTTVPLQPSASGIPEANHSSWLQHLWVEAIGVLFYLLARPPLRTDVAAAGCWSEPLTILFGP